MTIFINIFIALMIWIFISSIFIPFLEEKTKYKENTYTDNTVFLLILLGPLTYLFLNKIRHIRKINYYKYKLKNLKLIEKFGMDFSGQWRITVMYEEKEKEIKRIERLLALNKIKKWHQ